jgi:hypothetical protein
MEIRIPCAKNYTTKEIYQFSLNWQPYWMPSWILKKYAREIA